MSKKNRRKDKGVPMERRSTTYLPPMPKLSVMPPDDQFYGTSEYEAAAKVAKDLQDMINKQGMLVQSSTGFQQRVMGNFGGGANSPVKQVSLEERVHSSYTHSKEKDVFVSIDGLELPVSQIIRAPYLPGFALVHVDDPIALYCVDMINWYTPTAGKGSLQILTEHFAKKVIEAEQSHMFFASGGGGGGANKPSPFRVIDPADIKAAYEVKPWGALGELKGLESFIDEKAKEQHE
jgi:hypothetical protein